MKFTEQKAKEIQKQYGLASSWVADRRRRGTIPDKYVEGALGVMILGLNLRQLCSLRGITLGQVARDLGMSAKSVSNYASGKHIPQRKYYRALLEYFSEDERSQVPDDAKRALRILKQRQPSNNKNLTVKEKTLRRFRIVAARFYDLPIEDEFIQAFNFRPSYLYYFGKEAERANEVFEFVRKQCKANGVEIAIHLAPFLGISLGIALSKKNKPWQDLHHQLIQIQKRWQQ